MNLPPKVPGVPPKSTAELKVSHSKPEVSDEMMSMFQGELEKATLPEENALGKLQQLVELLEDYNDQIADMETSLSEFKERALELRQKEIPDLLAQYGLSEIKLANGKKVTIKQDCRASVKDFEAFYAFLQSRGEEDFIKTTLELGKMPSAAVVAAQKAVLQATGIAPESKTTIAPQTLFAWVRNNIGLGRHMPDEILDKDNIPGVSVYTFSDTKIK